VGADNTSTTFSGTFSGGGSLTKTGTGSVSITGNSGAVYTGTTSVEAGTLAINGDLSSSTIDVSGGAFTGTFTVRNIVATGGAIEPGGVGVVGTLYSIGTGGSSFNGATLNIDIDGATGDELDQVTNAVDLTGASLHINFVAAGSPGTVYTIISSPSVVGEFTNAADGATVDFNGQLYTVNYAATSVTLTAQSQAQAQSQFAFSAYVYAYAAYVNAVEAEQTGAGQFAYVAANYAYSSFYYAYYAYYFDAIGNKTASETCAYYASYYGYCAAYYSVYDYVTSGNNYAYSAYYYGWYSYVYSYMTALGY
jgi:autotransporter-associated beta strand protein